MYNLIISKKNEFVNSYQLMNLLKHINLKIPHSNTPPPYSEDINNYEQILVIKQQNSSTSTSLIITDKNKITTKLPKNDHEIFLF